MILDSMCRIAGQLIGLAWRVRGGRQLDIYKICHGWLMLHTAIPDFLKSTSAEGLIAIELLVRANNNAFFHNPNIITWLVIHRGA